MALPYNQLAIGNGAQSDHPIPELPFVDDAHLSLDDRHRLQTAECEPGGRAWEHTEQCIGGGWAALVADPIRRELTWVVRSHPEHGRSVTLYQTAGVAAVLAAYAQEPVLFRAGGYWWDGRTWYRPSRVFDDSEKVFKKRPVPGATSISVADLLEGGAGDASLGYVVTINDVSLDTDSYRDTGRRWRDDLARWAVHRQDQDLACCVVYLSAPELAADQLVAIAELAEADGIALSALRALHARDDGAVPLPQATVGGRRRWSRPVVEDWVEHRRRSCHGIASTTNSKTTAICR